MLRFIAARDAHAVTFRHLFSLPYLDPIDYAAGPCLCNAWPRHDGIAEACMKCKAGHLQATDMLMDIAFCNSPVVLKPCDALCDACTWVLSKTATARSDRAFTELVSVTGCMRLDGTHQWQGL